MKVRKNSSEVLKLVEHGDEEFFRSLEACVLSVVLLRVSSFWLLLLDKQEK